MSLFSFRAVDAGGKYIEGEQAAADIPELTAALMARGLFLMEGAPALAGDEATPLPPPLGKVRGSVPLDAMAMFTTELSIMLRTGLPLLDCLDTLARQQAHRVFRPMLEEISHDVSDGMPMSSACARYPGAFDEVVVSLLESGEASGTMPLMLERIAGYLNFQREFRDKARSAMVYPVIVISTALGVVVFLVLFILPTFVEVFGQLDMQLPLPTRILLAVSAHLRTFGALYLLAAAGAGVLFRAWLADPANRRKADRLLLDMPIGGKLVRNIVMTRALRTLSALDGAGVPILRSLELTRTAAGNLVFHDVFTQVRECAATGQGIAKALGESPYVPGQVVNMIANAERTGTLPDVLDKVSAYYEQETDIELKNLFAALEPVLVLFLGLLVGTIAVCMLDPVFSLGQFK